jgi:signal transduction histidine kinase
MKPGVASARGRVLVSSATLERRLLAGFGSTALVLIVAVFSFAELSSVSASKRWSQHTLSVIDAIHDVQTTLLTAETGQRGFLVTTDVAYLDTYREAGVRARTELLRLRELTADNQEQQRRLTVLERDVAARFASLDASLRLHDDHDLKAAIAHIGTGEGQAAMAHARGVLAELLAAEERLLQDRERENERGLHSTAAVIGGGSLVAFVLGLVTNIGIRRAVVERKHSQELIEEQAGRLESQTEVLLENERALAQRFDELAVANQKLDDQVHVLTKAKAEVDAALADLRQTSKALEMANRDLEQFAYAASHDLRAPLRGIASVTDWLEDDLGDSISDKARELLGLLHGRVARMEALIDGILAYSRISRYKDAREPVAVETLVREVAAQLSAKPGVVTIDVPDSMASIAVQKAPFQQVWLNLLGNALKHGAAERPEVHVAARSAGEHWEFSVSDNGPGIARQFHERIFRIFHTLASRDKVEGTGIGLAIVKKLVDDRGGRVWVESEPGKGAKFCFTWPK